MRSARLGGASGPPSGRGSALAKAWLMGESGSLEPCGQVNDLGSQCLHLLAQLAGGANLLLAVGRGRFVAQRLVLTHQHCNPRLQPLLLAGRVRVRRPPPFLMPSGKSLRQIRKSRLQTHVLGLQVDQPQIAVGGWRRRQDGLQPLAQAGDLAVAALQPFLAIRQIGHQLVQFRVQGLRRAASRRATNSLAMLTAEPAVWFARSMLLRCPFKAAISLFSRSISLSRATISICRALDDEAGFLVLLAKLGEFRPLRLQHFLGSGQRRRQCLHAVVACAAVRHAASAPPLRCAQVRPCWLHVRRRAP